MKHLSSLLTVSLLGCAALAASAQTLDPIVVTATRTELPRDAVITPVIVIDRDEIARSGATDVVELLRFHAGIDIGRNGGPGQTSSVFIRGTESNHALVLVDGVEVNPGTIGGAALQNISPRLLERIEIVKGPRSSLYGSEAIGGVINLIMRRADAPLHLETQVGAGRYGTRDVSVAGGIQRPGGHVSLSLSRNETDGYPTRVGFSEPDSGYRNFSAGLNAGLSLGGVDATLRHWHSEGNTQYMDLFAFTDPARDQDFANRATALGFTGSPAGSWKTTVTLSSIGDDIEQHQSPDYVTTRRNVIEWSNEVGLGTMHTLLGGLYVARENTETLSFGSGFDVDTDVDAVFVQDDIRLGRGRLLLAARYTDHETFGGHTTWNAEYAHRFGASLRIGAAAGTGFRAPDSTDRFGFGGNPLLEPETSRNLELRLQKSFGARHRLELNAFRQDIDDLIEFVFDPLSFSGENLNLARARITGLEAGYVWRGPAWRVRTAAIVQNPEDRDTGTTLARRARRTVTVNLAREIGAHQVGLDLLATGQRRDSPFSSIDNAGYVLASANASLNLGRHWTLRGRLENLLDTDYETAAGFANPGRGLYLSLQYQLD